ncbi:indole-3-glycerol phosphate synthase TrpC [Candidatus Methylacidithermus pantelleriae]|uniref:Indole-3-glycerol phosphate synthase n=1 Tax=Candidatus Methylacidithermus pantelleriae TaxID=2744239 RepID=A0A8J2BJ81_9BACT|nr:indole-3-glycerol phosphate synthase TrpC [Candidatus Methylacidithermus pantelleriae]CAF0689163.1 Indole-3-glycerol phosphate synthase [Candidatus Methylacidithermus pantelleriae]
MKFLEAIVAESYRRRRNSRENLRQWRKAAFGRTDFRSFASALRRQDGISLIAEIKRASPSTGLIAAEADPVFLAQQYEQGGADAVSVLTEPAFFLGSLDDLRRVRQTIAKPILRKDFLLEEGDLWESLAVGADAVLLIARILPPKRLQKLASRARSLGLEVLVEVHDRYELELALEAGSRIVGINNRDLRDFTVDLRTTEQLLPEIPPECIVVSESGIREPEQVGWLRNLGVDAILVGEALMRASDPSGKVRAFRKGGQGPLGARSRS